MFIPIQWGPSQSDNINQIIQLTMVHLSGGNCIKVNFLELLFLIAKFHIGVGPEKWQKVARIFCQAP